MSALIEEGQRLERELRALRTLADVVADLVTEATCPPELRAAWITAREAQR